MTDTIAAPEPPGGPDARGHRVVQRAAWVAATVAFIAVILAVLFVAFSNNDDPAAGRASTAHDDFARTVAHGLGQPTRGPAWNVVTGTWAVSDGMATATAGPATVPSGSGADGIGAAATLELGHGATGIAATVTRLVPEWGVAVRWHDTGNYVSVVARPAQGTWEVDARDHGAATELGTVSGFPPRNGSRLDVRVESSTVEVWIDGQFAKRFTDVHLPKGDAVALILGSKTSGTGGFGTVTAGPAPPDVVDVGPAGPGKPSS